MKKNKFIAYLLAPLCTLLFMQCKSAKKETEWISLFDGVSTKGWHTYNQDTVGTAWKVSDGVLYLDASQKDDWQVVGGGDIVTDEDFDNFHLELEWKISEGGNSGIIFFIHEEPGDTLYTYPWLTGPEMQVLDNEKHPDALIHKHKAGDLYDLIESKVTVKPAMQWNKAEIISNKSHLTFKLNGEVVLETNMWDENWKTLIAGSKFKDMPLFGTFKKGKIALQDHGDNVWFRNIRIQKL